jgi:hypothetical protein
MKHCLPAACVGIVLIFLLLLAGCGKKLVYFDDLFPDSGTAVPDSPEEPLKTNDRWLPMPDYDADAPHTESLTFVGTPFVETAHCIVFFDKRDSAVLKYISKATGEVRVLCGDPLCDHHNENCAARFDGFAANTLLYAPQTGRIYFARPYGSDNPLTQSYDLVSVGIDEMDLTLRFHGRTKPGDWLQFMRYDDGKLYYLYRTLTADDSVPGMQMDTLSLSSGTTRAVGNFSDGISAFTMRDGVVYYPDQLCILHAYDTATGENRELYVPELSAEGQNVQYILCGDRFFCRSNAYLKELDLTGKEIRTLWRSEETPYPALWTTDDGKTFYGLDCDPYNIDRTVYVRDQATGQKKPQLYTTVNVSGGKLLRRTDGTSEVIADLGERTLINELAVRGSCAFMVCRVFDDDDNEKSYYYYTFGGGTYELPLKGFPQG